MNRQNILIFIEIVLGSIGSFFFCLLFYHCLIASRLPGPWIQDVILIFPLLILLFPCVLMLFAARGTIQGQTWAPKLNRFILLYIILIGSILLWRQVSKLISYAGTEMALTKGDTITVDTSLGMFEIIAVNKHKRTYKWANCSVSVMPDPRAYRWYGSKGTYLLDQLKESPENCPHIEWIDMEEGQRHYSREEEALEWIQTQIKMDKTRYPHTTHVYSNDGLYIRWGFHKRNAKALEDDTLMAEFYQIYINGEEPAYLAGSKDDKIKKW